MANMLEGAPLLFAQSKVNAPLLGQSTPPLVKARSTHPSFGHTTHLHICQRELLALCHELAVAGDTGSAIEIEAAAITALLVGIQVDAARL